MNDADLDNSRVVDVVTGVLYVGWLSGLSTIALYFGVEPLPSVAARFPGWRGTVAALAVGVAFLLVSRQVFDQLKKRYRNARKPVVSASDVPPRSTSGPGSDKKRKRKRKKKKR